MHHSRWKSLRKLRKEKRSLIIGTYKNKFKNKNLIYANYINSWNYTKKTNPLAILQIIKLDELVKFTLVHQKDFKFEAWSLSNKYIPYNRSYTRFIYFTKEQHRKKTHVVWCFLLVLGDLSGIIEWGYFHHAISCTWIMWTYTCEFFFPAERIVVVHEL